VILRIQQFRVHTVIGTNDWERHRPQEVFVNIELDVDARAAVEHDDLAGTVDYAALCERIQTQAREKRRFLLERFASEILNLVLAEAPVRSATVEVTKPNVLPAVQAVSVRLSGTNAPGA